MQVGKEVKDTMDEMAKRFPHGLQYAIPYDTTIFVQDSIAEVYRTLYEAGILVLIVILVFLQNFRATLVPATTVPVTIIGAFAGMAALGFTVNLSTLFGIVLAIGIVVDDAIVIVEGVTKYIERGMSGHDAAIQAMNELFGPIIGITLVLMAVFIPAAFVPGLTGNMFAQFALVIAATAFISAINAATLKPTQCALWLRTPKPPEQRNFFFRFFNHIYDPMERGYAALIGRMVNHSGLMVVLALIVSGVGFWGLTRIPTAFIPIDDQGYLMVAVQLARGRIARPHHRHPGKGDGGGAQDSRRRSRDHPRRHIAARQQRRPLQRRGRLGDAEALLGPAEGEGPGPAPHLPDGSRRRWLRCLTARPTCCRRPPSRASATPGGFQMQVELLGGSTDYEKLGNLTNQIVAAADADPALSNVLTTFRTEAPHVTLMVDRDRAQTLRVSVGDVFSTLTDFVGSTYVNQFNKFGLSLQVYVQADSRFRLHPEDLLSLYVRSQDGYMVPIGAVAHLGSTVAPPLLTLYNLYPSSTIVGAPGARLQLRPGANGDGVDRQARAACDVSYEWTAMSYQEKITGNQLYYVFGLSILLVYLVPGGPVRELDPAARGALGGAARVAWSGDRADEPRGGATTSIPRSA